ncbi:MAG TPA: long-chain fatty acid--CoA ligase [Gemmata sp.]|nr:long-chain fatty acid--CoA ligase [Gemmata sp.]
MERAIQTLPECPWSAHYPAGVPGHIDYPAEPAFWLLEEAARHTPDRVACRYFNQELTYSMLLEESRRMAAFLRRRGLESGERVGILLPNVPEYLIALFGAWMAGGVVVPINPLMVDEEVGGLIDATQCRVIVCLDVLLPLLKDHRPATVLVTSLKDRLPWLARQVYKIVRLHRLGFRRQPGGELDLALALASAPPEETLRRPTPEDAAEILPTGGTTGHPKGVVLTHRNLLANALQVFHWNQRPIGKDVMLACLPFFHSYGLTVCGLSGIAMSATLVMHHRFRSTHILQLMERTRPTLVPAVPAMLAAFNRVLRNRSYDLKSVEAVISGGAPLPPDVAEEFAKHTGAVVVEGYGLSEASPVTHVGPLDGNARPGTIGIPLPDTEALVVDAETGNEELPPGQVGELIIRGPQVMAGYWNDPEATAVALRDGWLYTGDLASRDEDGFFKIVDRKKDLIITSGFNVYPTDVETVLRQFPGIEDIAIFGVPDAVRGELVKAVVVPADPAKFSHRAFEDYAKHHLEVHRRPRVVEVVPGPLPRNPLGKLLRRVLREQFPDNTPHHDHSPAEHPGG